ncbi:MAG: hypothetical protein JXB25_06915 [Deltaproteobacteria bacterium]|nr:hypothetical protein [Deltaproteobacteria bacterium]
MNVKTALRRFGPARRSRLAPHWLQAFHEAGLAFPRLSQWPAKHPRICIYGLILSSGSAVLARVAFDTDLLSGFLVASIGGPLFALTFFLILPLLIPVAALAFFLLRVICRIIAHLCDWVLPDPKNQGRWRTQDCPRLQTLGQTRRKQEVGRVEPDAQPLWLLLGKVAEIWRGE